MFKVKDLIVSAEGREILKGMNLQVEPGEIHVLMGPNGSGKSTLAQVIAGHPAYKIDGGRLLFSGKNINKLTPDKRAKLGVFLGFQHPVEVPGVSVFNFLRRAKGSKVRVDEGLRKTNGKKLKLDSVSAFRQELLEYASSLKLSNDILRRSLNEGFSGGEKKRNEILQMMALSPKLVILDEIDSGLDVDGLRLVAESIKRFKKQNHKSSIILITHYARILKYLKPDSVHVMVQGKIVKSGKMILASEVEERGYQSI